jgi:hypothetical protein
MTTHNPWANTKHYYYVCPFCGETTGKMKVTALNYKPDEIELMKRPYMASIGHEMLLCTCGVSLTWFDVEEINLK